MTRGKAVPLPRYVEPASVDEGDVIRVTWKVGDVTHTREGKVGRIVNGKLTRQFISPDGNMIAELGYQKPRVRVTLLAEGEKHAPVPLFEFAEQA